MKGSSGAEREFSAEIESLGGSERLASVVNRSSRAVLAEEVCLNTKQRDRQLPYIIGADANCLVSIVVDVDSRCCPAQTKPLSRVLYLQMAFNKEFFVLLESQVNYATSISVLRV